LHNHNAICILALSPQTYKTVDLYPIKIVEKPRINPGTPKETIISTQRFHLKNAVLWKRLL